MRLEAELKKCAVVRGCGWTKAYRSFESERCGCVVMREDGSIGGTADTVSCQMVECVVNSFECYTYAVDGIRGVRRPDFG